MKMKMREIRIWELGIRISEIKLSELCASAVKLFLPQRRKDAEGFWMRMRIKIKLMGKIGDLDSGYGQGE